MNEVTVNLTSDIMRPMLYVCTIFENFQFKIGDVNVGEDIWKNTENIQIAVAQRRHI